MLHGNSAKEALDCALSSVLHVAHSCTQLRLRVTARGTGETCDAYNVGTLWRKGTSKWNLSLEIDRRARTRHRKPRKGVAMHGNSSRSKAFSGQIRVFREVLHACNTTAFPRSVGRWEHHLALVSSREHHYAFVSSSEYHFTSVCNIIQCCVHKYFS
jgi:hypothetical protein